MVCTSAPSADEASALATRALSPTLTASCGRAGAAVELQDISVASRVLGHFPGFCKAEQRAGDILAELGVLTQGRQACIIKLLQVSASVPQLEECIEEPQGQGFTSPNYPRGTPG